MPKKQPKTNAMRLLEQAGVAYEALYYDLGGEEFSGPAVSRALGLEMRVCFKTLCARGRSGALFVFSIPVEGELDLRAAASAAGEKKIELVPVKELLSLTGYERGAVSPIGIRHPHRFFLDRSAELSGTVAVSGGRKGCSLLVDARELTDCLKGAFAPLTAPKEEESSSL